MHDIWIDTEYWDGTYPNERRSLSGKGAPLTAEVAHAEALQASKELRADISVMDGATVLATYRNGRAMEDEAEG